MGVAADDCVSGAVEPAFAGCVSRELWDSVEIVASRKRLAHSSCPVLLRIEFPPITVRTVCMPLAEIQAQEDYGGVSILSGRREQSAKKQMRRQVDYEHQERKYCDEVQGPRAPRPVEKRVSVNKVDIRFGRTRQSSEHDYRNCYGRLHNPASAVVSNAVQRPQKEKRHHNVKQRE